MFENLFEEKTASSTKSQSGTLFGGLFDEKETPDKEETIGLGKGEVISTYKKEEEPLWKRAAKFVLPKAGEKFFGLDEPMPEKDIGKQMMDIEKDKEKYLVERGELKNITLNRHTKNFIIGIGGTAEGMVGAAEWLSPDIMKPFFEEKGDQVELWQQKMMPEDRKFIDDLVSGAGSVVTFFIPGMGIVKGASVIAKVSPKIAMLFGNIAATTLEAMTEAGSVYREKRNSGADAKEASWAATKTFGANSILIALTNKFGIFSEKVGSGIKRMAVSAPMEGIQEYFQEVIQNVNTGKPAFENAFKSGVIGTILGVPMGGISGTAFNNLPVDDQKRIIEGRVESKIKEEEEKITPTEEITPVKPSDITAVKPITPEEAIKAKEVEPELLAKVELEPLAKEAGKYKSADEFVSSFQKAFHGTPTKLKEIGFGEGIRSRTFMGTTEQVKSGAIFFSPNKEVADFFGKNRAEWLSDLGKETKPSVYERYLNIKNPADLTTIESAQKVFDKAKIDIPKTFNLSTYDEVMSLETYINELGEVQLDDMWQAFDKSEIVSAFKKAGYDGAIIKETGDRGISYAIFNPKQAFTKSQLTDIYNKVTKGVTKEKAVDITGGIEYNKTGKKFQVGITSVKGYEPTAADKTVDKAKKLESEGKFGPATKAYQESLVPGIDAIKKLFPPDGIKIREIIGSYGRYFGETEPTIYVKFDVEEESVNEFVSKVANLANNTFKQNSVIIHKWISSSEKYGIINEEAGLSYEPAVSITLTKKITLKSAAFLDKLFTKYDLAGATITPNGYGIELMNLSAYDKNYEKFSQNTQDLITDFNSRGIYGSSKSGVKETRHIGIDKDQALTTYGRIRSGVQAVSEKGEKVKPTAIKETEAPVKGEVLPLVEEELKKIIRGTKGLTADQIMQEYPDIKLERDVPAKDIYGNKVTIDKDEILTPYELKGNKVLLQDGETYVVSKNQFQNIKGNAEVKEAKKFAPELKGTEETVKAEGIIPKLGGSVFKLQDKFAKKLFNEDKFYKLTGYQKEKLFNDPEYIKQYNETFENQKLSEEEIKPKYSNYTLPGGKNYKEILIQAPETTKDLRTVYSDLAKKYDAGQITKEEYKIQKSQAERTFKSGTSFKSAHWDEPNVIAHLRINERDYKSKDVTFMEELQSDWAREGREQGFITETNKTRTEQLNRKKEAKGLTSQEAEELISLMVDRDAKLKIPNHPLLKNWQELTIKRALQESVKNNSDYFAWINGEQTTARYNLSTQVKEVRWYKSARGDLIGKKRIKIDPIGGGNIIAFNVDEKGIISDGVKDWNGKKLNEVIGKGLADSIMAKEEGRLSGEGLKFGGEWADNLYDKQVKNIVEDLTGGKVEVLDMGLPVEANQEKMNIWVITNKTKLGESIADSVKSARLTEKDIKIGLAINKSQYGRGVENYVITDVLGDGKFKAVLKKEISKQYEVLLTPDNTDGVYGKYMVREVGKTGRTGTFYNTKTEAERHIKEYYEDYIKETFDISTKTTTQQAIKLTPEIKAKIKSKTPLWKKSQKGLKEEVIKEKPKLKGQIIKDLDSSGVKIKPSQVTSAEEASAGTKPLSLGDHISVISPPSGVLEMRYSLPSKLYKPVKSIVDIKLIDKLSNDLMIAYKRAFVKAGEVDKKMHDIIQKISGSDYNVRIKRVERVMKKTREVRDILGGALIVKDTKDIASGIKELESNFNIIPETVRNYFEKPNKWGYRGVNANVLDDTGLIYEVQLHTEATRKAALKAHPHYEKWSNKGTDLSPEELIERDIDLKASNDIFEKALSDEAVKELASEQLKGKPTKVAESIKAKATEKDIVDQFKGLAEYEPVVIKEQIALIEKLMAEDMDKAIRMATGKQPLSGGVKGAMLIKMMEDYAMEKKDGNLILELVNSPLVSETSEAGQTLRLIGEREPDAATARIQEVKKEREKVAEKRRRGKTDKKVKDSMKNNLENTIEKSKKKVNKRSWASLLDEITC